MFFALGSRSVATLSSPNFEVSQSLEVVDKLIGQIDLMQILQITKNSKSIQKDLEKFPLTLITKNSKSIEIDLENFP